MPFRIREFGAGDFERLWRIDRECFPEGIAYSKQELKEYLGRRGAFCYVAEREDSARVRAARTRSSEIAGFILGESDRRKMGHVITIDVLPHARRAGLGSQLMSMAEERFQKAGCSAIVLETAVDNVTAIRFYRRRGYSILKTIPRYYMGSIDALLFYKRIEDVSVLTS